MKEYTLNKLNCTKIVNDETKVEKYKKLGFKVVKVKEVETDAAKESKEVQVQGEVESETFTCEVCGKPYKTEASLKKHILDKHQTTENPEQEETNVKNKNDVEVETSETNEETESEE